MSFFENGHGENTKAVVHGALGGLALACCSYNMIAWFKRRDVHLARNAVVYLGLTLYEGAKVHRHLNAGKLLVGLVVALALSATLIARQFPVALTRLDCVNQPSTHLLVNDSADWTAYAFDASMALVPEDSPQKLYLVEVAPHARLVVCVG